MDKSILVMGLGNLVMGDEGLGVAFARAMEKEDLPEYVTVMDGGTGGFHLMGHLEAHPKVILVDATMDGGVPGAIRLIRPRFASDFPKAISTHDIGLKDLIEGMQILGKMPDIYLFVVTIETIQPFYVGLTPEIEAVIPRVIQEVKQLITQLISE